MAYYTCMNFRAKKDDKSKKRYETSFAFYESKRESVVKYLNN